MPSIWASWKPFGLGEQRPNNYLEIARAAWANRDSPIHAWRILRRGVCDGCALGTSGLHDWTLKGIHLCNIRLRLLRINTMPALQPDRLADANRLRELSGARLRALGRLHSPMVRYRGEAGFTAIGWEEAMNLAAARVRAAPPQGLAFYLTSRGMSNESYYAAQKAARALGTNSIDNAARVCHSPSTAALKAQLGLAATTCSYPDLIGTDLVVFIGSNVANNQPVMTKYLHYAKKAGTKIAVVNTYREPGMERYWVPSVAESALFGTKLADRFFLLRPGGDAAFLTGVLKELAARDQVDHQFIERHTHGFGELSRRLQRLGWDDLEAAAGAPRSEMRELARLMAMAPSAVLVWSMGVTQHECGEENVHAIVNLALARGYMGREGTGLMPIRGHSGVQGGAEMGAYATGFPGGRPVDAASARQLAELWGFPVPDQPGLTAPEMIDAAHEGKLAVLFSAGGNFLEVMPDPGFVQEALSRIPLRIHMDLLMSSQMLVDPADTVLLLPAATRYESPGGITQTSTERRVIFSPEIRGQRSVDARAEWEVLSDLAARARPDLEPALHFRSAEDIRTEIARVVPAYEGIERLRRAGDQFQVGGPMLCRDGSFPTRDGRARFQVPKLADPAAGAAEITDAGGAAGAVDRTFLLTTRRGKQFNSMVLERRDSLTGASRESVLMCPEDASRLRLRQGDRIELSSRSGTYRGRVRLAPVSPGSLQVHWPEGNVLIDRHLRSPVAGIPDYGARVTVEKVKKGSSARPTDGRKRHGPVPPP